MSIFDIFAKLEQQRSSAPSGKIEWIVAGLGNPGLQYENTRHNAGFLALDQLAQNAGAQIQRLKFRARCGEAVLEGHRVLLMKPDTYMNNSGEALEAALQFYKLPPQQLLVLYDDISMEPGRLRIRRKGSAGGHNGIKSIIALTGSEEFSRIKIGVGKKPHPDYDLKDWVLSGFSEEDRQTMQDAFARAAEAAALIVAGKSEEAMNRFNS